MDLRHYFRKLREVEGSIVEEYPLVVSRETSDGGRAGRVSEVTRVLAAQLIVEGKALLADADERALHLLSQEEAKSAMERAELARRVQVAIVTDGDLNSNSMNKKK